MYSISTRKPGKVDFSNEERCKKRQKLEYISASASRFRSLAPECRMRILQFLDEDDLHCSYALVSKKCFLECKNLSLQQIKTGEIKCNYCMFALFRKLVLVGLHNIFEYPREKLKLTGHHRIGRANIGELKGTFIYRESRNSMENCKILDMSLPEAGLTKTDRKVPGSLPKALSLLLSNLREVNLNHVNVCQSAASDFAKNCPKLEVFRWKGASGGFFCVGQDLKRCENLKELYIDNAMMYSVNESYAHCLFDEHFESYCPLMQCNKNLVRVSMKNAKHYNSTRERSHKPIPQSGLVKFVRLTKTLRWFCSDLSKENSEMLQRERPEVVFRSY